MKYRTGLFGAFGLMFSLIVGLISSMILPVSIDAQKENKTAQPESKKKEKSKKKGKERSATKTDSPSGDGQSPPLSTNEDPSQIGKRNINKGFTGWRGGSKEKEIAVGRQFAVMPGFSPRKSDLMNSVCNFPF